MSTSRAHTPRRVGIYARLSQATAEAGEQSDAISRQLADCRALCERRGWDVHDEYVDDGISAYLNKERPAYSRLVRDIQDGVIDTMVVWRLDRAWRSTAQLGGFLGATQEIHHKGMNQAAVVSVMDEHLDTTSAQGQVMLSLMVSLAQMESSSTQVRIRRAAEERRRQGRSVSNVIPFGWRDRRFEDVHEEQAALLVDAAKRIVAGESARIISDEWTRAGVERPSLGAKPWRARMLTQMLRKPSMWGAVWSEADGRYYTGGIAPIMDRELWEACKTALDARATARIEPPRRARKYLLTGLIFCGVCGSRATGDAGVHRRTKNGVERERRYLCSSERRCTCITPAADVDEFVREAVFARIEGGAVTRMLAAAAEDDAQLSELMARAGALRDQLASYTAELATMIGPAARSTEGFARETVAQIVSSTQQQLEEAERAMARHTARVGGLTDSLEETVREQWDEQTLEWRRELIRALCERVTIMPSGPGRARGVSRLEITWRA